MKRSVLCIIGLHDWRYEPGGFTLIKYAPEGNSRYCLRCGKSQYWEPLVGLWHNMPVETEVRRMMYETYGSFTGPKPRRFLW